MITTLLYSSDKPLFILSICIEQAEFVIYKVVLKHTIHTATALSIVQFTKEHNFSIVSKPSCNKRNYETCRTA